MYGIARVKVIPMMQRTIRISIKEKPFRFMVPPVVNAIVSMHYREMS
jgi:hypothetical protein